MGFNLPEKITIWNRTGSDGLGGGTWSAPIQYPARIAYEQQKFTDTNGDVRVSTAVCYSNGATLSIGSHVFFGASSDAFPPPESNDVRAISQTPSGAGALKKAWFS